jgi:hypothetical protein
MIPISRRYAYRRRVDRSRLLVNVKRINTVSASLMGGPAVVAPVEFDADRE